eukprot:tig00021357_g20771.t1
MAGCWDGGPPPVPFTSASVPIDPSAADHFEDFPPFNFEDPAAEGELCYDILMSPEEAVSMLPDLSQDLSGGFVFDPPSDLIILPYNFEDPPLLQQAAIRCTPGLQHVSFSQKSLPESPRRRRRSLAEMQHSAPPDGPALGADFLGGSRVVHPIRIRRTPSAALQAQQAQSGSSFACSSQQHQLQQEREEQQEQQQQQQAAAAMRDEATSPVLPISLDGLLSLNIGGQGPSSAPRQPETPLAGGLAVKAESAPRAAASPSPASSSLQGAASGMPSPSPKQSGPGRGARSGSQPGAAPAAAIVEQTPAGSLHSRLVASLRSIEVHFDPVASYTRMRAGAVGPVATCGPRSVELHRDFTFDIAPTVREGGVEVYYVNTSKKHALRVTPADGIAEVYPVLVAADSGEAVDGEPIVSITKARVETAARKVRVEAQAKGGPMLLEEGAQPVLQAPGLVFRRKGGFGRSLYAIAAVGRRPDGDAELLGFIAPLRCVTREDQIPGYAPPDPNAPRERPRKKYRVTSSKRSGSNDELGPGPPGGPATSPEGPAPLLSPAGSAAEGPAPLPARGARPEVPAGVSLAGPSSEQRDAAELGLDPLSPFPVPDEAQSLASLIADSPYSNFLGACI